MSRQSLTAASHGAAGQTAPQPTETGLGTSAFFFFVELYLSIYLLFLAMLGFTAAWAFLYTLGAMHRLL